MARSVETRIEILEALLDTSADFVVIDAGNTGDDADAMLAAYHAQTPVIERAQVVVVVNDPCRALRGAAPQALPPPGSTASL